MANISPEAYTTYGMLSKYDWSPSFKAALMGSIDVETGGSFDYQKKQDNGGPGRGLFQFEKKHLNDYRKYLKDNGLTDSAENQIEFVYKNMTIDSYSKDKQGKYVSNAPHEIGGTNRGMLQDAMKNQDINDSTESLMDDYFHSGVPHEDRRKKESEKYRKAFKIKP